MLDIIKKVSVLMPVYNGAEYIQQSVDSIWRESAHVKEIIIVDDGSTDKTLKILMDLACISPINMKVFHHDNMGVSKTLNRALSLAQGEFIAILAADDIFLPNRFQSQMGILAKGGSVPVAYGNGIRIDKTGIVLPLIENRIEILLNQNVSTILTYLYTHPTPFPIQTGLFRKDLLDAIGGFDPKIRDVEDMALNIKIFEYLQKTALSHAYIPEHLVGYRVHEKNVSQTSDLVLNGTLQTFQRYTPQDLLPKAQSNIYWAYGLKFFLTDRLFKKGLSYIIRSQELYFNPGKLNIISACIKKIKKTVEMHKFNKKFGKYATLFKNDNVSTLNKTGSP